MVLSEPDRTCKFEKLYFSSLFHKGFRFLPPSPFFFLLPRDVCLGLSVPQSSEQNQDLLNTGRMWNPSERSSLHNKSHYICISHKLSKVGHSQLNYRERRKASAPWQQYSVSHQFGAFCQHDTALWGCISSIHPTYQVTPLTEKLTYHERQ